MKGRKRVTWFLPPETIRRVKVEAAKSDTDQSTVVDEACREYFARRDTIPAPRRGKAEAASA